MGFFDFFRRKRSKVLAPPTPARDATPVGYLRGEVSRSERSRDDGDFATSMAVGMMTDNALLGYAVGGDLGGAMLGAAMADSPDSSPSNDSCDSGSSDPGSYDSGSCDSGSSDFGSSDSGSSDFGGCGSD